MLDHESYSHAVALLGSNKILELHILPTEQCNFRCLYCYEDFKKGGMRPEIRTAVKRLLDARVPNLDVLNISWFGGEPLLRKDIVLEISSYAKAIADISGCQFVGSATTNGWLLDIESARTLATAGVTSYQITLDGPKHIHDMSRIKQGGDGTFDRIWANLTAIAASDLDCDIMIRLHIRPDTIGAVRAWLPDLRSLTRGDPRFTVLVKPIEHLGGPNDKSVAAYATDAEREAAAGSIYRDLGLSGPPRSDLFAMACYAARPNAWVIRSDGNLNKCTVALNSRRNHVGELMPDGTMRIDQEKIRPWFKGLETLDPEILGCPATAVLTW